MNRMEAGDHRVCCHVVCGKAGDERGELSEAELVISGTRLWSETLFPRITVERTCL